MLTTVGEIKNQLRKELKNLETEILSSLPDDDAAVVQYHVSIQDRDDEASLLEDMIAIIPKLRCDYSPEQVTEIMMAKGGLAVLLSKWKHRVGFLIQQYID